MPAKPGEEILQEYTKRFWQNSKFWLGVVLLLIIAVFALVYKKTVMNTSMTPAELKAAVEFFDISSQWKVNEKVNDEDFQGIILVPEVSFRMRNVSKRDLSYVFLLGVFRFMDTGKVIGEGYRMALRQAVAPGRGQREDHPERRLRLPGHLGGGLRKIQAGLAQFPLRGVRQVAQFRVRPAEDLLHQPPDRRAWILRSRSAKPAYFSSAAILSLSSSPRSWLAAIFPWRLMTKVEGM